MFLEALKLYGKDWKKVQEFVGTRTTTQARSHAQKYYAKAERGGNESGAELSLNENSLASSTAPHTDRNGNALSPTTGKVPVAPSMPELVVERTRSKAKKKVLGPFKPGKRPIMCDSMNDGNYANIEKKKARKDLALDSVPVKLEGTESIGFSQLSKIVRYPHEELPEQDKTFPRQPSFGSFLPEQNDALQSHALNDKSQFSEFDFDVAPNDIIRPLDLEPSLSKFGPSLEQPESLKSEESRNGIENKPTGVEDIFDIFSTIGTGK